MLSIPRSSHLRQKPVAARIGLSAQNALPLRASSQSPPASHPSPTMAATCRRPRLRSTNARTVPQYCQPSVRALGAARLSAPVPASTHRAPPESPRSARMIRRVGTLFNGRTLPKDWPPAFRSDGGRECASDTTHGTSGCTDCIHHPIPDPAFDALRPTKQCQQGRRYARLHNRAHRRIRVG